LDTPHSGIPTSKDRQSLVGCTRAATHLGLMADRDPSRIHLGPSGSPGWETGIVYRGATQPSQVRDWLAENRVRVLNVAGNRESKAPGLGARVERFLALVFRGPAAGG
jgi:hypothetical protein